MKFNNRSHGDGFSIAASPSFQSRACCGRYVLLGAAVLAGALGEWLDAGVILAVVLVNATIGFIQEGKAERALAAIQGMLASNTTVLRQGQKQEVQTADLVPGDIVLLEAGDKVPADLRLLKTKNTQCQESMLTGESVPVDKSPAAVQAELQLADRSNMAYSGTLVTQGTARGLVVSTGADTELGRINRMLSNVELLQTPLLKNMAQFARYLTMVVILGALAVFALGILRGNDPIYLFMAVREPGGRGYTRRPAHYPDRGAGDWGNKNGSAEEYYPAPASRRDSGSSVGYLFR